MMTAALARQVYGIGILLMMAKKVTKGMALLLIGTAMMLGVPGCGGGGFTPPNVIAALVATIGQVSSLTDPTTGETILSIDYTVTGDPGQSFGLEFKFFVDANGNGMPDAGESEFSMTEISTALEALFGVTSENGSNLSLATGSASGTFYWQAGADLGFVGATVCVEITPTGALSGQTVQTGIQCNVTYDGGSPPVTVSGGNIGPGAAQPGRGRHTAHAVDTMPNPSLLAVGGVDGGANAVSTLDRFDLDLGNRMQVLAFSQAGQNTRVRHASAFFFNSQGNVSVLVTGGTNTGPVTLGSTPTALNTADIYGFSPTESVTATGSTMQMDRERHAACWLPNNTVLITGGVGTNAGTSTSAEIYDPVSDSFSLVASLPGPRADHTCTLLPNGMVLLAGGRDPMNPTTPQPAFLYDFRTNTWSSTGTNIDRYQHTATLLVNGVCALIGGRKVSDDSVVATADFYRSFPENNGGIPAGFTSSASVALSAARTEHAAALLGSTEILVTGGFDNGAPGSALDSAEVFIPTPFTSLTIGMFSPVTALTTARARHTSTTLPGGSNVLLGGVTGTMGMESALNTIEVYQFNNSAPTVSNIAVSTPSGPAAAGITFDLADAEGDRAFVIVRFSTDGGQTYQFATLTDYAKTVNLAPGSYTLTWNATADGLSAGQAVMLEIIPVGGRMGTPATASFTL